MKKTLIFFIACCLSLVWGATGRADQKLFDEEILNILKEKNIITPEKYQELSHKLKSEKQSVNEEILDLLQDKKIITEAKHQELKEKAIQEKKATEKLVELPEGLKGLKVGALWYIDYKNGVKSNQSFNEYTLDRGYIDIQKQITPWFAARVTPDITRTSNGDIELRIKYLYGKFSPPDLKGVLTKNYIEVGQIHVPWLDFEESINPYRCQGTMFLERNNIFNSADIGIGSFGYFGGEMPEEYKKTVNGSYAGRYGSYALGVYNGGGYHAGENNKNKVFEGRLTLRPLPDYLPGLQLTYANITGRANLKKDTTHLIYFDDQSDALLNINRQVLHESPDWRMNNAFLSYQNCWGAFAGQYAWGRGSQTGTFTLNGQPANTTMVDNRDWKGFSLFGYVKVPWDKRFRLFGRYDRWDPDTDVSNNFEQRYIAGLSFDIYKENMLVVDYEHDYSESGDLSGSNPKQHFIQTVLQIKY